MNESAKEQYQTPEGRLLERAMKKPPKISGRKLAELADLSEGRVRQIVNGYKSEGGMMIPVSAPAETIARLGDALDIRPEEFEEIGRVDVADILRGNVTSGLTEEGDLWLSDLNVHRVALLDWLQSGVESDPPTDPLILWEIDDLLAAVARKHRDETRFLNNLITMFRAPKGGDGNADAPAGGSAPNKVPASGPAEQPDEDYLGLAAHEEDFTIEQEQEGDEFP